MKILLNKLCCLTLLLVSMGGTFIALAMEKDIHAQLTKLTSLSPNDTAVIVVDVQSDFTQAKNGNLAVNGTDNRYVEQAKEVAQFFKDKGYKIYATQDWHPENHTSFAKTHGMQPFVVRDNKMYWPVHCQQNTPGAKILLPEALIIK